MFYPHMYSVYLVQYIRTVVHIQNYEGTQLRCTIKNNRFSQKKNQHIATDTQGIRKPICLLKALFKNSSINDPKLQY